MPVFKEAAIDAKEAIDWQRGKELMNGDLAEAKQLLCQLLNYVPKVLRQIRKTFNNNDLDKLLLHVHKLHGACSYCGVPRLKQAAKNLEIAIRKNRSDQLTELTHALESECKLLLQAAKQDSILNEQSSIR